MTPFGLGLGGALSPLAIPGTTSFAAASFTTHTDTVSETVAMLPSADGPFGFGTTLTDGVGASPSILVGWAAAALTDTITASYLINVVRAQSAELSDTISMSPGLSFVLGLLVTEQLRPVALRRAISFSQNVWG